MTTSIWRDVIKLLIRSLLFYKIIMVHKIVHHSAPPKLFKHNCYTYIPYIADISAI